jgi:hypothetical protein
MRATPGDDVQGKGVSDLVPATYRRKDTKSPCRRGEYYYPE